MFRGLQDKVGRVVRMGDAGGRGDCWSGYCVLHLIGRILREKVVLSHTYGSTTSYNLCVTYAQTMHLVP